MQVSTVYGFKMAVCEYKDLETHYSVIICLHKYLFSYRGHIVDIFHSALQLTLIPGLADGRRAFKLE